MLRINLKWFLFVLALFIFFFHQSLPTIQAQTGPTPTTQLPCPSGFQVNCAASGNQVTISWNVVSGATSYNVRLNANPFINWFVPAEGDQFINTTSTQPVINITPALSYRYDVQGINPPNMGLRCPFADFVCNAPTATPTLTATPIPSATPTPGNWYKVKDASFYKHANVDVSVASTVNAFDSDDPGKRLFMDDDLALIATENVSGVGTVETSWVPASAINMNKSNWKMIGSLPQGNIGNFFGYVKARKEYVTVTIGKLQDNKINYITGPVTLNNTLFTGNDTPLTKFVLTVDGQVTIDQQTFNDTVKSIVIYSTGEIIFSANTKVANGIFIAQNATVADDAGDNGFKIKGNLALANALTRNRTRTTLSKPTYFIVFDPKMYLDLLPLLSTTTYEWKQTQ